MELETQYQYSRPAKQAILAVDDEPQILTALEDTFEDDFTVLTESSAAAAIRLIEHAPNLCVILSDQRMPGMTGDEFLAKAQELSSATRILITGYADLDAVVKAVNSGHIFGYISKPWTPSTLKLLVFKAAERFELLRKLRAEQELLHKLLDNTPDAICFKDREHRIIRLNKVRARLLNLTDPDKAIGRLESDFLPSALAEAIAEEDRAVLIKGQTLFDQVKKDERGLETRWFSSSKGPIHDERGEITGLVSIKRDITQRMRAEEDLRMSEEQLNLALQSAGMGTWSWDIRNDTVIWDDFTYPLFGLRPGAFGGRPQDFSECVHPDDRERVQHEVNAAVRNGRDYDTEFRVIWPQDGSVHILGSRGKVRFDQAGQPQRMSGVFWDITDYRKAQQRIEYLSQYDPATGLANRTLFQDRLKQALLQAQRRKELVGVLVCRLESLKAVIEAYGYDVSEQMLREVGQRLEQILGNSGSLGRGGDNVFLLALTGFQKFEDISQVVLNLRAELDRTLKTNGNEIQTTARIGIAVYPNDSKEAMGLLRNADIACDRIEDKTGIAYQFYTSDMHTRLHHRLTLQQEFRRALERNEFVLHYQPQVDLRRGRIVGAEALVRWLLPDGRLVPPGQFIPLAEEIGLIVPLGEWVLYTACTQMQAWRKEGLLAIDQAVNVASQQLQRETFVQQLENCLSTTGIPADQLKLELTESTLMVDTEQTVKLMAILQEMGIRLAIDDFGTGYSSLNYLTRLPVETLKIDRSFVIKMTEYAQDAAIVEAIINLAHSLDLKVVAEGVETTEQLAFLRAYRCDFLQGYLYSKPVPAEEFRRLLIEQPPLTTATPPRTR